MPGMAYLLERVRGQSIDTVFSATIEAMHAGRHSETLTSFVDLDAVESMSMRELQQGDRAQVRAAIEKFEGPECAAAFERALDEDLLLTVVVTGPGGEVLSFGANLRDMEAFRTLAQYDPIAGLTLARWTRQTRFPVETDYARWYFTLEDYQAFTGSMGALILAGPWLSWATANNSRQVLYSMEMPELWSELAVHLNMVSLPELDHAGPSGRTRRLHVAPLERMGMQGGTEALALTEAYASIALLFSGFIDPTSPPPPRPAPTEPEAIQPLSADDWRDLLHGASRCFRRPLDLARDPVLDELDRVGALPLGVSDQARVAAFFGILRSLCDELERNADYEDALRAFRVTHLPPGQKQEAAAAELGIAYGTYRYRLRRGLALIAQGLAARTQAAPG